MEKFIQSTNLYLLRKLRWKWRRYKERFIYGTKEAEENCKTERVGMGTNEEIR